MKMSITNSAYAAIKAAEEILRQVAGDEARVVNMDLRSFHNELENPEKVGYEARVFFVKGIAWGVIKATIILEKSDRRIPFNGHVWRFSSATIFSTGRDGPGAGKKFVSHDGIPVIAE